MTRPRAKPSRRHHTVPVFYLRGFALNDQLSTLTLPNPVPFTQSVKDATVEIDFHTIAGHPDGDDVIENAIAGFEGDAAAIFKKIESGIWPLTPDDRTALAHFMALQSARVPQQRRTMEELWSQVLRLHIGIGGKDELAAQLRSENPEIDDQAIDNAWARSVRPEGPQVKRQTVEHLRQMIETSDKLMPYFVGRPWTLHRFDRRSLLTSDAPVVLVASPDHDPELGVGYATAWGITFPLTRKLGLVMSSPEPLWEQGVAAAAIVDGTYDHAEDGTTRLEKFLNYHTVFGASRWVFHHPEDGRFVPDQLPEPNPVSMRMSGATDMDFNVDAPH